MGAVFTNISVLVADLGTGDALIQRQSVDSILESSVFWLNLAIAVSLSSVLFFASPNIASFYGEPLVEDIVSILAAVIIIQSINLVQVALFKKNRNFRAIAFAEFGSQICGAIVAITLASLSFGVWSLVYYALTKALFYTSIIWFFSSWRPRFEFDLNAVLTIFSFSLNLTLTKFLNYVERNSDKLIIGYSNGTSSLGIYTRAYEAFHQIIKLVNGFYNPVFYSIAAKNQLNKTYLKKILLLSYQGLIFLFLPIFLILFFYSSELIIIVFGNKWIDMSPILTVLSFAFLIKPINKLNVEIFKSLDKVVMLRKIWMFFTPIFVIGFFIGNFVYGSLGVAISLVIITSVITLTTTLMLLKYFEIKIGHARKIFDNLFVRGMIVILIYVLIENIMPISDIGSFSNMFIVLKILILGAIYLLLQLVFPCEAQQRIARFIKRKGVR